MTLMDARPMAYPNHLEAPGVGTEFRPALPVRDLPPGALRRVTFDELDVLIAHTPEGIVAVDDRCPHMSAPLSIGELDGCVVACPLHEGRFDLFSGDPVQMPTTGGLWPDGRYHPVWTPGGKIAKDDVPGKKADARKLTRVRRFRYYPVRIQDGTIDVAIPETTPGTIHVAPADPTWPDMFAAIRDRIAPALGDLAIAIEHVGSTSVPGLAAKPVIDLDVIVADATHLPEAIARLGTLGYEHQGDLGVPDRHAFRRPPGSARHNLYVCVDGCESLRNHLAIRDHLRAHADTAARYAALKETLAAEGIGIDEYVERKTGFLTEILRAEGFDDEAIARIEDSNRANRRS
jgi:GrpB-like predicted nucleotidyltransferase (UPF0157 family)/nitrite reductase/ring-hydroxylating ferredoxin subunit